MIDRWVQVWNTEEVPTPLAAVRIGVGLCIAGDLVLTAALGLVPLLYGGWGLWTLKLVAALMVAAGLFTPVSAIVLVLASAQLALHIHALDRGVDVLLRDVLVVLAFSACGQTWSLDCWRRTGGWVDGSPAPAWPRKLLVLQLVAVYFVAGITKFAVPWSVFGGYSALWFVLHDPHYSRFPSLPDAVYPLTQLGTAVTVWWEMAFPAIYLGRRTRLAFVAVGVVFHLLLLVTVRIGSFPIGVLVLYPVFFSHEDWVDLSRWAFPRSPPARAGG